MDTSILGGQETAKTLWVTCRRSLVSFTTELHVFLAQDALKLKICGAGSAVGLTAAPCQQAGTCQQLTSLEFSALLLGLGLAQVPPILTRHTVDKTAQELQSSRRSSPLLNHSASPGFPEENGRCPGKSGLRLEVFQHQEGEAAAGPAQAAPSVSFILPGAEFRREAAVRDWGGGSSEQPPATDRMLPLEGPSGPFLCNPFRIKAASESRLKCRFRCPLDSY
ncbi:uncharacterized protein LOC118025890 [Mirounga leonina]|uniref:uncharacterized protein LOC118025890 n=1 Tax=Mirounga leonina TaxID=9715 RepID=UPI00156C19BA|nr:uncharacterized protein LOC118025890 [Mirounga leonina]